MVRLALADPLLAVAVVAILVRGAYRVLRESATILLEAAPKGIDIDAVRSALTQVAGVLEIHHVHAWALTGEKPMVTLHARVSDGIDEESTLSRIKEVLLESFGIDHSTVQVERSDCPDEDESSTRGAAVHASIGADLRPDECFSAEELQRPVDQRRHRVPSDLPRGIHALAPTMQAQVETRDDRELVGGERAEPVEIGQRITVGLDV